MELLKQILKKIIPTEEEIIRVNKIISSFINQLNKELNKYDAKAILGGSGAKGTWLSGTSDADIFVQFNYRIYNKKDEQLSNILEKALKKAFKKVERLHGSRDYFRLSQDNFIFEVIPILEIKKASQAKNITDISPLHAQWVKANIKNLADEVRLTKAFCKANACYGAESYIRGFSGYVCEILTVYYSSFINLLKAATKWKHKEIIDPAGYYNGQNALKKLNKSKIQSPIIIIDPVQADRNAAAALSKEKLEKFKKAAQQFLKKPSKKFFEKKQITIEKLKESTKKPILIIEAMPLQGKEDIIGSKLLKAKDYIEKKLLEQEFELISSDWTWNKEKVLFWYVLKKTILSASQERIGPPIREKRDAERFKNKYKKTYTKNNRLYARIKRKFRKPDALIKKLAKDEYLKDKIKELRIIR